MASRNGQFLLFDALPFLGPLPLDLLRRRCVGMVDAASWIGANLDNLPALTAVHDNRLSHLVTGFLNGREFGARAVRLGLPTSRLPVIRSELSVSTRRIGAIFLQQRDRAQGAS